MKKRSIKASEFDKVFDSGEEDILQFVDLKKATQPGLAQRRVSVDFPEWMVDQLDKISKRLGVTRQSIIKIFISDRLEEEAGK